MPVNLSRELLDEVSDNLDLRDTNRAAIESVILATSDHYHDGGAAPFECIIDSATGVGKTYALAGLIDYLALSPDPVRNFLILTPGRTIRDKTIRNLTPGDQKSLTAGMRSRPYVVTADNFDSPATMAAMEDDTLTKVYVFTVQVLTSATGEGRAPHEYREALGGSLYHWLASRPDLVILADEHHCYQGPGYSRTIRELNPQLVVGLTATPTPDTEHLIVYRYPLAAAIADRLVKTPVIVGRNDDRTDVETKLRDAVHLLRLKEQAVMTYCADTGAQPVNPVMLVIAQSIDDAERLRDFLDSTTFDGGAWAGRTLLVHSKLTGDEKEDMLQALDGVEDAASPVRIIISVGMLKEGWDVKNIYVLASLRASVSTILTEQTLGRGLRLPFGRYTGVEFLDTIEVLAHERYEELLAKRDVLNQSFIDYRIHMHERRRPDGSTVVEKRSDAVGVPELLPDTTGGDSSEDHAVSPQPVQGTAGEGGFRIVDIRERDVDTDEDGMQFLDLLPNPQRASILIPRVTQTQVKSEVSLAQIDDADYARFERLGRALASDISPNLRRTRITAKKGLRDVKVGLEETTEQVSAALAFDIPLPESRKMLLGRVMELRGIQQRAGEYRIAERIVDTVITAMGDEAGATLSAYGHNCADRLAQEAQNLLDRLSAGGSGVRFEDAVEQIALDGRRTARKKVSDGHPDGGFDRNTAFDGWKKNLYDYAWFDSTPEYKAAIAFDDAGSVLVWARLHVGDVPIRWNRDGREYNPDFVVIENVDGQSHGWLVETKSDREMSSTEVQAKKAGARTWARVVNADPATNSQWHYLLLGERDIDLAHGSFDALKRIGE